MHVDGRKNGCAWMLVRVDMDGNEEPVATPASFEEGWQAGTSRTHAEPRMAFSLYRPDGSRAARFCHHRLATNDATASLDMLVLQMAYEERECWKCDRGRVLRSSHPMERPTWTVCGHCDGTGTVSVFVYPRRKRRAS